ncbi:MAG: hypothetical protein RLZ55_910 [Actinomycetota bacterium]|jgi:5'-3' exonuclease
MADAPPRIMLLDTASLYFRAYFGVPDTFRSPDGTPVNAVRGLLDFIARLVRDYSPTDLVACWDDDWRPAFRVELLPEYKAQRVAEVVEPGGDADAAEEVPDTLAPQVPIIEELLAALGIARVGAPGFEADDVIGTLSARATGPARIVTGDRDLFQLVDDARGVAVLYTAARGVSRAELVDADWLVQRYGIPQGTYGDYSILRGDPSDGLPGVRGVGERTAASLLRAYGSLAGVRAAAADPGTAMRPALRAKIVGATDYLDRAERVVTVVRDVPLPQLPSTALPSTAPDPAALAELAARWGVDSSVARVTAAMARAST